MFCNKCGTQNPDTSIFCSKCGEKLNISTEANVPAKSPKKRKTGLLVGIAGGVAVIAAAVVLVLIFTGATRPVTGDWYSKEISETMSFYVDGIVLIANENGEVKGLYKYDERSGQGVINVNGFDISFTVDGDTLVFSGDEPTRFVRFDGGVTVAGIVPTPPSLTPPPETTPAEPAVTTAPEVTSAPTENPPATIPTPTPATVTLGPPVTPPPTPTPTPTPVPTPVPDDNTDVMGRWRNVDTYGNAWILTLHGDNTYDISLAGTVLETGTYKYYPLTLSGTYKTQFGYKWNFNLSSNKQELNWADMLFTPYNPK